MNPFTRFLRSLQSGSPRRKLDTFVALWDVVEAIVVDVYKRGAALEEERAAYARARGALLREYEKVWAPRFASHWQQTIEAGSPTPADPFLRILAPAGADGFIGNWAAMQALAAARETLNRYLLTLS